jgi:tetratricopeptide (TPR) repeat protein
MPVEGESIDADAPVAYRLPDVSSFAPTPVQAAASPPPRTVIPPQPPAAALIGESPAPADRALGTKTGELHAGQTTSPDPATPAAKFNQLERSSLNDNLGVPVLALPPSGDLEPAQSAVPRTGLNRGFDGPPTSSIALPATSTTAELTSKLLPVIQRGYDLAQHGALFAAQTEFVQVLRRIAQAKDVASRNDDHSRALAAGLRALDEAEDFVPSGIQLEADLDLAIIASSHRTPVLRNYPEEVLAHEAAALYVGYAQAQLARAVAGEQAGSMSLHGLGKIYAQLAQNSGDDLLLTQRAMAMFAAALDARPDNHLAANELGVLLCRGGRAADAAPLFERAIDAEPSALAYHNLAVAQQKLGLHGQAAANEQESQRLAAWERANGDVSRRAGVQWVAPNQMARVAQPGPLAQASYNAAGPVTPIPQHADAISQDKSPWQRVADFGRSLSLPGLDSTKNIRNAHPETRIAQPLATPRTGGQTQWR